MTPLSLSDTDPAELAVDAIVVGLHSTPATGGGAPLLAPGAESVAVAFDGQARRDPGPARRDRRGRRGDQARHARHRLRARDRRGRPGPGAGGRRRSRRDAAPGRRRRGPGAGRGGRRWRWRCRRPDGTATAPPPLRAIAEGALLGTYRFAGYKTKPQPGRREPVKARRRCTWPTPRTRRPGPRSSGPAVVAGGGRPHPGLGQHARPTSCARRASPTAGRAGRGRQAGLEVEVLDEKALKKGGYGGILAVGHGFGGAAPAGRDLATPRRARPRRSRWSARASRSTPAATRSSRPQGMWEMKSDMSGAAAVASVMVALAALKPKVAVTAYLPMAENMISGYGLPARRRGHHVRRQAGRGAQHRRRGPHDPGRRDRAGQEDEPGLPVRDLHPHRRPGHRAGQADRRRDGRRRRCASGYARPATGSASRPGRCRCRTRCARAWTPTSPTSRRSTRVWTGPATCCRVARSCASSSREGLPWAHIDIAGPGLPLGRADRLLDQGRDRRTRADPAGADRRHRRRTADCAQGLSPAALAALVDSRACAWG